MPFLLAANGVEVEEAEPWIEGEETWRVLRAHFPGTIATHSFVQEIFFGEDLRIRRHDYRVDVAGAFEIGHFAYNYVEADGLRLPTQCRAFGRGPGRQVNRDPLLASVDISDVRFS